MGTGNAEWGDGPRCCRRRRVERDRRDRESARRGGAAVAGRPHFHQFANCQFLRFCMRQKDFPDKKKDIGCALLSLPLSHFHSPSPVSCDPSPFTPLPQRYVLLGVCCDYVMPKKTCRLSFNMSPMAINLSARSRAHQSRPTRTSFSLSLPRTRAHALLISCAALPCLSARSEGHQVWARVGKCWLEKKKHPLLKKSYPWSPDCFSKNNTPPHFFLEKSLYRSRIRKALFIRYSAPLWLCTARRTHGLTFLRDS